MKVSVQAQGSYPELLKKYEDSLGTPADLPDVVFGEDTTLQFMVDSGSVIAAADCIEADPDASEFYDDLLAPVENAYTVQGKLWAGGLRRVDADHVRQQRSPARRRVEHRGLPGDPR